MVDFQKPICDIKFEEQKRYSIVFENEIRSYILYTYRLYVYMHRRDI